MEILSDDFLEWNGCVYHSTSSLPSCRSILRRTCRSPPWDSPVWSTSSPTCLCVTLRDPPAPETGSSSPREARFLKVCNANLTLLMLLLKYLSFSSTVASNHSYLTEAYVSDHLVSSIHWLLRAHPSGVPLREFSSIFQVGTAWRLVDLH